MIRELARRVPLPLSIVRSRGDSRGERLEARLEMACAWGAGHLLVTGDRADTRDLLERILRRIDPLGTVRARACSADSEAALDGLVALSEEGGPIPFDRCERRRALLRLLDRARSTRRSVFIVVDDADDATVAQLERLRVGVEVAPDAIERLRLVLLGGSALVSKLEDRAARALTSRITSRVCLDARGRESAGRHIARTTAKTRMPRLTAIAAGASLALLAYGATRLVVAPERGGASLALVRASAAPSLVAAASAPKPVIHVRTGMRGDEPFVGTSLRIPIHASWTTGSGLLPPPPQKIDSVPSVAPAAAAPADATGSPRPRPAVGAETPEAPVKIATELTAGTSIAALVARFR